MSDYEPFTPPVGLVHGAGPGGASLAAMVAHPRFVLPAPAIDATEPAHPGHTLPSARQLVDAEPVPAQSPEGDAAYALAGALPPIPDVIDLDVPLTEEERQLYGGAFLEPHERIAQANALVRQAYDLLPFTAPMPVGRVQWVPVNLVMANDYNPNTVPHHEMNLLHTSISEDGYTQPVVAIWDPAAVSSDGPKEPGRYVIVDGFHRWTVLRRFPDIAEQTGGFIPVVVIDKPVADRIASTVRHNRARGKHSVGGMSNLVFAMLMAGESDATICKKIGLEAEELARLKHITGYSKLYANQEYSPLVMTKTQQDEKRAYALAHPDEHVPEDI